MTLWWGLLVLGVGLCATGTTAGMIAAYGDKRVPRWGFWPDTRARRSPWWSYLALFFGILLLGFTTGRLASWDSWTAPVLLFGCVLVGWTIQGSVIAIHNQRRAAKTANPARDERAQQG